jgi:hypothetical protein
MTRPVRDGAPAMLEVREELGLASINCCQVPTAIYPRGGCWLDHAWRRDSRLGP